MLFGSKSFCLVAALSPLWLASQALAFDAEQCRSIQFGAGVPPDAEYTVPDDFLVEPGGTGNELDCFIFTNSGGDFELSVIEPFPRDVLLRLQYFSGEVSLLYPRENGGLTAIAGCFADVLPEVSYRCRAYLTTTNGDPEFVQDLDETFTTIESRIEGSLRLLLEDEQRDAFWSTAGDARTLEMVVEGREGAAPLEADPETQSYATRDVSDITQIMEYFDGDNVRLGIHATWMGDGKQLFSRTTLQMDNAGYVIQEYGALGLFIQTQLAAAAQ